MEVQGVTLQKSDIEFFEQHGAVCLREAFDEHWIDVMRKGVERNLENPSKFFLTLVESDDGPSFVMDYNAWQTIPEYEQVIRHSPIGAYAGNLMGWEEVNFLEDNIFCSRNGQSAPTKWHQDSSYYEICGDVCSIWVSLDEITKDDCISIVSGSHRWGRSFLPTSFSGEREKVCNQAPYIPPHFERMIDVDQELDKHTMLSWDMKVGDCIALHGDVIHGKFRSDTGKSLRRITLRFVGQDAYWNKNDLPWQELEMGHGDLQPGDRLNCDLFPLVWSRNDD